MASTGIHHLPLELIQEIGRQSRQASQLASLASTSSTFRQALLPTLYRDLLVSSYERLSELSNASPDLLGLIRHLTIHVDLPFFDAWNNSSCPPYLATILSHTPLLHSLAIRMDDTPYETPWNRFGGHKEMCGIMLGLDTAALPIFERLKNLELQATSLVDIDSLLLHTPNLTGLRLVSPDVVKDVELPSLMAGLHSVPHLNTLSVSLCGWDSRPEDCHSSSAFHLLPEMGDMLPSLEELDLRISYYDFVDGMFKRGIVPASASVEQDITSIISSFASLRSLRLPLAIKGDTLQPSTSIAGALPSLETLSWMQTEDSSEDVNYSITRTVRRDAYRNLGIVDISVALTTALAAIPSPESLPTPPPTPSFFNLSHSLFESSGYKSILFDTVPSLLVNTSLAAFSFLCGAFYL